MARTHGLDKRLAEEQAAMASTKQAKHHSHTATTQDSIAKPGSHGAVKRYDSGSNVSKGGSRPGPGAGGKVGSAGPKKGATSA